jgi:nicotinate-nucleotide adenylyltransferase
VQKIGIYGGTFDPIHHAHLILARAALEEFGLDHLLFILAASSPHKSSPHAPAESRLEMLRAAIVNENYFAIDDCELRRPPPSYTIDTIEQLAKRYSDAELFFLLGDDNLPSLPSWKRFDELRKLVSFIILRRAKIPLQHQYRAVEMRIEISSTEIRERVAKERSIRYLVPEAVEEIIRAQQLYREVRK